MNFVDFLILFWLKEKSKKTENVLLVCTEKLKIH